MDRTIGAKIVVNHLPKIECERSRRFKNRADTVSESCGVLSLPGAPKQLMNAGGMIRVNE
jgi:hypothetical protein